MSSIEWTQKTWNTVTGCTKVSAGCKFCYAEKETERLQRFRQKKYRHGFNKVVVHNKYLKLPIEKKKGVTWFVNSMSDLFHKDIPLKHIQDVFKVMNDTPQHTYQILTKRDDTLLKYSPSLTWTDNIWMGVTVENQDCTKRISNLQKCGAKKKFLSIEPLIGEITSLPLKKIDWVIVGGESGAKARPLELDWIKKIQQFCKNDNVPFFFKQYGKDEFNPNHKDPTKSKLHSFYSKGGNQIDGKTYWENPSVKNFCIKTINLFGKDYEIMEEVNGLSTIWELKSYLPFNSKENYTELKKDIKRNGVRDPILYWVNKSGEKLVIEGHTRLRACNELKLKSFPSKEVKEEFNSLEDIRLWMIKHQCNRRNLSSIDRVKLTYQMKNVISQQAKSNQIKGGQKEAVTSIDTLQELGQIAGVSKATMQRYDNIIASGNKTIIKKLHNGEISIGAASKNLPNKTKSKVKKEPDQDNSKTPTNFDNIEKATESLNKGNIDYIIITKKPEVEKVIVKRHLTEKLGVVIVKD